MSNEERKTLPCLKFAKACVRNEKREVLPCYGYEAKRQVFLKHSEASEQGQ